MSKLPLPSDWRPAGMLQTGDRLTVFGIGFVYPDDRRVVEYVREPFFLLFQDDGGRVWAVSEMHRISDDEPVEHSPGCPDAEIADMAQH